MSKRDANRTRVICVVTVCLSVLLLTQFRWEFPKLQDLPSAELRQLFGQSSSSDAIRRSAQEDNTSTTQTRIFYNYNEKKLLAHYQLSSTLDLDSLAVIPGLASTLSFNSWGGTPTVSHAMVPQGIAVSDTWIFISAYDGNYVANSVIYMISRSDGMLQKTIILQGQPHVGGLAYDSRNDRLWIATRKDKKAQLVGISLRKLKSYPNGSTNPITYDFEVSLPKLKRASFIEYYEGSLYVGFFNTASNGVMYRFKLTSLGRLTEQEAQHPTSRYVILPQVQGVAITSDRIFFSQSYGGGASVLYVFENEGGGDYAAKDPLAKTQVPAMMEDITVYDGILYAAYESAAANYREKYGVGIDRIVTYPLESIPAALTQEGGQ
ncbi:MAG: hypothetical protein GX481_00295 [Atopobium sp.]|nr:hypothetical protein [Atopobium sp.]